MKMKWMLAIVLVLGAVVFAACHHPAPTDGPTIVQGDPGTGSGSGSGDGAAGTGQAVPRGNSPVGTWHEQAEPADTLEITKSKVVYTSHDGSYSDEVKYSYSGIGEEPELKLSDLFMYEDMYYNKAEDMIIAYTWSHTDGDGGHHRVEYRRAKYVAPPPPTYAPPANNSDPGAKKEFEDFTVGTMKVSFYDEGEPYDISSSMAPQPPFADQYSYDLTVLPDGTGLVSSSFCREIDLTKEQVEKVQEIVREADLGSLNGLDIHTEGLPYGSPEYEAEIELESGDIFRSSANGPDVAESWKSFQESLHRYLFFTFVDAGYHYNGGEFHSTKPMKRVLGEETLRREDTGLQRDTVIINPDWKKSYDYSLDTKYFVFTDPGNKYPELMKTLNRLSEQYKKKAEETLKKQYEVMEAVPKSVWKKADRKYSYSLYAIDQWSLSGNIFHILVAEGEANSMGAGYYGYGQYRNTMYNIDVNTGEILTLSDLFTSTDALCDALMEKYGEYGTHNDSGKFVHSAEFPAFLRNAVQALPPEGYDWSAFYDYVEIWMPLGAFEGNDSQMREILYYDEMQEILGDKYTREW